jgi:AraC family transcriptional regulator
VAIIPEACDGRWGHRRPDQRRPRIPHPGAASECAETLEANHPLEFFARVGFEDPVAAWVMELLGRDAATPGDPASRLFVEQATDLPVTQLVRGHSSFGAIVPLPRRGRHPTADEGALVSFGYAFREPPAGQFAKGSFANQNAPL